MERYLEQLGEPNLKVAGFQLWVHDYQFPDATDYWDGNWLNVTANCGAEGASVLTSGAIVHLAELHRFYAQCEEAFRTLSGTAKLECMEPQLAIVLSAGTAGHFLMEVMITPNHLTQKHWFQFDIDQSYLSQVLAACERIFQDYPLRGEHEKHGT